MPATLATPSGTRNTHDPAEAAWVADHEPIVRKVARWRAGSRRDRIEDYEQVGRMALIEAYRTLDAKLVAASYGGEAGYARELVRRRTARLWMTDFETIRPPTRFGRYAAKLGRPAAVVTEGLGDWDTEDEGRNAVEKVDDADAVEHATKVLTAIEKSHVDQRFVQEIPVKLIAEAWGVSESCIKSTLRRALDKMRVALERGGVEG